MGTLFLMLCGAVIWGCAYEILHRLQTWESGRNSSQTQMGERKDRRDCRTASVKDADRAIEEFNSEKS